MADTLVKNLGRKRPSARRVPLAARTAPARGADGRLVAPRGPSLFAVLVAAAPAAPAASAAPAPGIVAERLRQARLAERVRQARVALRSARFGYAEAIRSAAPRGKLLVSALAFRKAQLALALALGERGISETSAVAMAADQLVKLDVAPAKAQLKTPAATVAQNSLRAVRSVVLRGMRALSLLGARAEKGLRNAMKAYLAIIAPRPAGTLQAGESA